MSQHNEFNDEHANVPHEAEVNPFSADLKEDFGSPDFGSPDFGSSEKGFGQVFKGGLFSGENRVKLLALVLIVVAALAGGYLYLGDGGSQEEDLLLGDEEQLFEEEFVEDDTSKELVGDDQDFIAEEEQAPEQAQAVIPITSNPSPAASSSPSLAKQTGGKQAVQPTPNLEETLSSPALTETVANSKTIAEPKSRETLSFEKRDMPVSSTLATLPPVLTSPVNDAMHHYDETASDAKFTWKGSPGGWIYFARNRAMKPLSFKKKVKGNQFVFRHAYPGTWYWKVVNAAGSSSVQSFKVTPPQPRQISLSLPQAQGVLSAQGGLVSWMGDKKIAYYRVEISNNGWTNPLYRFATTATQVQIQNVPAGQYQLRLGAFSEVAGRWEYTSPIDVTIQ